MLVDPATPLFDVTFVVLDVETTGGSPETGALTEIGAAAFRSGERLGVFDTLVDPHRPVPDFIAELTGITDDMVLGAPRLEAVLPSLVEFVAGGVVVGHNVAFDIGFVDAALVATGRLPLANPSLDTLPLARSLVAGDTPDCGLSSLAATLDLAHRPCHRALADALATADLLHRLIEAAAGYGVSTFGELASVPERIPAPNRAHLAVDRASATPAA